MRIVITGQKGMLGSILFQQLKTAGHDCLGLDLPEFDVTDRSKVLSAISEFKPKVIYNCAAYTNVDGCETNESTAFAVNATAVKILVETAKALDCVLVHISTDFIFSGKATTPYLTDAMPDPLSAYGRTKLAGEKYIQDIWPQKSFIVRTAWLYGLRSKNFVETIIRLAKERDELKIVDDQIGAPTFANDLAQFLVLLLDSQAYGVYHYTNSGQVSRYDFAKYFLSKLKLPPRVIPCKTFDFPRPAPVPAYSVLDLTKTEKQFKIRIPEWQDGMNRYLVIRERT
jgi:dTDP-4-dehydrorhamnose reductase